MLELHFVLKADAICASLVIKPTKLVKVGIGCLSDKMHPIIQSLILAGTCASLPFVLLYNGGIQLWLFHIKVGHNIGLTKIEMHASSMRWRE